MTEALELLISRGHDFDNLWSKYTMDQVWLFLRAAHENIKHETLDLAVATRAAFRADKSGWQKFIQTLSPKKIISKASEIMPKEKYRQIRRLLSGK